MSKDGTLIIPGTFVSQNNGEMRNTCYGFCDGKILFEYDKINFSFQEKEFAKKYGLKPVSGDSPATFSWKGLEIGVEICKDVSLLKKETNNLDLLFLIACGAPTLLCSIDAVKQGGYGVLVDGSVPVSYVDFKSD
jgi:predicted amidohydrolase